MDNSFNEQSPNNNIAYGQQPSQPNSQLIGSQQFQGISSQPNTAPMAPAQKKNTLVYAIIAIVAVIVAIIVGVLIGKGMASNNGATDAPAVSGQATSTTTPPASSSSDSGTSVTTLDAKELKDTYDSVNFKQYIGKKITIINLMAYLNDDGTVSLSPGLMSFFGVSCDNVQTLNLASSEWYTITGVLNSSTILASSYHLSNCTATQQKM